MGIRYILLIAFTAIFFSGCSAKMAPKTKIPPAPKVKNIDQNLSLNTQRKIQKEYFKYQNNLVTGVITAAINIKDRNEYYNSLKNTDMQKERLYECKINEMRGNYGKPFFHEMFLVSNLRTPNKEVSIAIHKYNVEQYLVYKNGILGTKDGGYTFFDIDVDNKDAGLKNVIAIFYKCKRIKNTLFKKDDFIPSYK